MPTQRHRTVIQIDVDDRKIRGLDRTLHRAFDDNMLSSFERVLDRSARTLDAMTKAAERFEKVMARAGSGGGGGSGRDARGGGGGDLGGAIRALTQQVQQLNRGGGRGGGGGGGGGGGRGPGFFNRAAATSIGTWAGSTASATSGEGFMAQAAGGIPLIGGYIRGAINSIHNYANQYAGMRQGQAQLYGGLGMAGAPGGYNRFTARGMAMPQAHQAIGQWAQGAGRSGRGVSEAFASTNLDLQTLGGISQGGGILRAAETGVERRHQGTAPARMMMQAVSSGLQIGIREARLPQFIGAATQVLEQGRLEGTDLRLRSVMQTMAGVAGLGGGFRGEQGSRYAGGAINAMRNFRPQQDVASLVGLRAVGFGSEGGPGYHEALAMFQNEPERVMPQVLQAIRGMAPGNEVAQVELMTQIGERLFGNRPTVQQARSMVRGGAASEAGFGSGEDLSTEHADAWLAQRREGAGGVFGVAASEAGLQNQRIGTGGGETYRASRRMQRSELRLLRQAIPRVAGMINSMLDGINEGLRAFREDGVSGLGRLLYEGIGEAIQNATTAAFEELSGADAEEAARATQHLAENPGDAAVAVAGQMGVLINETAAVIAEAVSDDPLAGNVYRRAGGRAQQVTDRALGRPAAEELADNLDAAAGSARRLATEGATSPADVATGGN